MALSLFPRAGFDTSLSVTRRSNLIRFSLLSFACLSLLAAPRAQAREEIIGAPPVHAGVLECQGDQNIGRVVTSIASLDCIFHSDGYPPEPYLATIRRYGIDLGVTAETRMAWAVTAPAERPGHGELAGHYDGVSANASFGVGFGGHFLVGGPANATLLQPIGVQRQFGMNVAAGAADLELTPVRLVHRPGRAARRGRRADR
jgi:hypothetical protein